VVLMNKESNGNHFCDPKSPLECSCHRNHWTKYVDIQSGRVRTPFSLLQTQMLLRILGNPQCGYWTGLEGNGSEHVTAI
jgi:hypothetical protein